MVSTDGECSKVLEVKEKLGLDFYTWQFTYEFECNKYTIKMLKDLLNNVYLTLLKR